ncbi:MAG: c-type cytochrome [Deltaproteobacteria bacterium]|nr:c-type cytochrome [Deltaproteobacteria bacterium]MCK5711037.1 c-type cytochrome [Deltaproteobacteria bacterium]
MKNICSILTLSSLVILALVSAIAVSCHRKPATELTYSPERIEIGQAVVEGWNCGFCHTPEIKGPDGKPMPDPKRLMSGYPSDEEVPTIPDMVITSPEWMEFLDNLDSTVWATDNLLIFSANLTPDDETGIGTWTETEFVETIRQGRHRGIERRIKYPMPWQELSELSDEELLSVYEYLMTLEPVNNKVPPSIVLFR